MDTAQEKETSTETVVTPEVVTAGVTPTIVATPVVTTSFYQKYKQFIAGFLGVLIVLFGYYAYTTWYVQEDAVAVVNGKNISVTEFNESIALIEQNATLQGVDITDATTKEEIRTQALDTLINNALIITAAENAGITVTDEKFKEAYDTLVTEVGGAETLTLRMTEIGLTEEKLNSNIKERIIADQYIESQTDIENLSVSEEEVQAFITALNAPEGQLPPLEEIRLQVEAQILSQKQQQLIIDLLAKLRSEAKIEMKI